MLDSMIASALKKLLKTQSNFWNRVSVEEQRAQKQDRFLRGRQIAHMIYEYSLQPALMKQYKVFQLCSLSVYRMTMSRFRRQMGSCFIICKWNTLRYDPGRIVQVKIEKFRSTPDCDGFVYDQKSCSKSRKAWLSSIENFCDASYWSNNENSKLQVREDVVERGSVTKGQKGNRAYVERKVEECLLWKAHGQCSKGDSWTKRTIGTNILKGIRQ